MDFNVFVSYSTQDLDHVEALRAQLANPPLKLFVAEYSVSAGNDLPQEIKNAIRSCDLFVLIWSNHAKKSAWVSQEIGFAEAQSKTILPLVINPKCPPGGFLSNLKYLPLYKDLNAGIEEAKSVAMRAYEDKFQKLQQQQQQQQKQKSSEEGLVVAGIVAFVLWTMAKK